MQMSDYTVHEILKLYYTNMNCKYTGAVQNNKVQTNNTNISSINRTY